MRLNLLHYNVLIATVLSIFCSRVIATIQEEDLIIFEGARYYTHSLPSLTEALPGIKIPDFIAVSTANWKGYRASWAIIDNQMYLIGVEGWLKQTEGERIHYSKELFPDLKFPYKITKFNGKIKLEGRGDDYEIVNGDRVETKEIILKFQNGTVKKISRKTINSDKISRDEGIELFKKHHLKANFEQYFTFEKIETGKGKIYGVYFDAPEWRADFLPKERLKYHCEVEGVFPIIDDHIVIKISPDEIMSALKKITIHPFVIERFQNGGATGIRVRITGDRLHWNTEELQKLHKKQKNKDIKEDELRNWSYIIIDAKEPRFTSFYLNVTNNDLLTDD